MSSARDEVLEKAQDVVASYVASRGRSNPWSSLSTLLRQMQREYEDRFLYELVQNAYDAHPADADGEIAILLAEDEADHGVLYVANRGNPFTRENFDAICELAQSNKTPDESIGNKGVGFKSVLQVCEWPEIYSRAHQDSSGFNGYCFTFARPDAYLDAEHVGALAASIQLQGLLVPLVVRASDSRYELVAGFHRFAAVKQLGANVIDSVAVVVRDADHQDAARAVENITRKQLRPDEEARAVKAMLNRGYTEDGAAQALGWPKARVTARLKLLALPDRAIELVGAGQVTLSAVDQLLAIERVSAPLLDTVIEFLTTDPWAAGRLAREPGSVLDSVLRVDDSNVFAVWLNTVDDYDVRALKLGKKADANWERAVELTKQWDRYAYGARIQFTDAEIDQGRAAGVTIEFERGAPLIVDRKLYRELVK